MGSRPSGGSAAIAVNPVEENAAMGMTGQQGHNPNSLAQSQKARGKVVVEKRATDGQAQVLIGTNQSQNPMSQGAAAAQG